MVLTQILSHLSSLVRELPILSNFDDVLEGQPKKRKKNNNYEHDNYENEKWRNFLGIPENFQFLSWNWINFWKYYPFSASFDHLVQIIQ